MNDLMRLSCEEFLEKLASKEPVPGGGGAAALGGAIGAALAAMVANLTVGKEKFLDVERKMLKVFTDAETLRKELLQLVQDDATVFRTFMDCYKMPQVTEKEKKMRTEKIQEAAQKATEIPLQIAEKSLAVLFLAEEAAELGNPAVVTDAAIAALMSRAAVRSAVYNVKINLNLLRDKDYCEIVRRRLFALEQKAEQIETRVLMQTEHILKI